MQLECSMAASIGKKYPSLKHYLKYTACSINHGYTSSMVGPDVWAAAVEPRQPPSNIMCIHRPICMTQCCVQVRAAVTSQKEVTTVTTMTYKTKGVRRSDSVEESSEEEEETDNAVEPTTGESLLRGLVS